MAITHKPKAGALLTGTEWEAADAHEGTLTAAEVGAAPDDATYLVTTANAGLSAEVAVGATPGGELGGTWASPTVDATHSGSTHAATQAAAEATAASALTTHAGAADPHTVYRLESDDHSHASTGAQAGKLAQANTHESPDTDAAAGSLHHTVGTSATQAAAGNHSHTGNAPDSADYLVGTASGSLSGEIVVGTSPGGELGGTWDAPTVDIVHAGATAWATYTPAWTATTTNPTLGSTTIVGRWKKLDTNTVAVRINIAITTGGAWNAGSGTYIFSLPAGITSSASGSFQLLNAHVLDAGTAHFSGTAKVGSGATTIGETVIADATGNRLLAHNIPVTWATGDNINISGIIEVA